MCTFFSLKYITFKYQRCKKSEEPAQLTATKSTTVLKEASMRMSDFKQCHLQIISYSQMFSMLGHNNRPLY